MPNTAITRPGMTFPLPIFEENSATNSIVGPERHIAAPTHIFAVRFSLFLRATSNSFLFWRMRNTIHDTIIAISSAVRRIKSASCVDERPKKSATPTTIGPGHSILLKREACALLILFSKNHTPINEPKES